MPIVQVGQNEIEFPDSMSTADITAVLHKHYGTPAQNQRKFSLRSELAGAADTQFQAAQEASASRQPSGILDYIPEGAQRVVGSFAQYGSDLARLGAEYIPSNPIPGTLTYGLEAPVKRAFKSVADYLGDAASGLRMSQNSDPEVRDPIGDVVRRAQTKTPSQNLQNVLSVLQMGPASAVSPDVAANAANIGTFAVNTIADNSAQLALGGVVMKALRAAGIAAKLAARLAPMIAVAPQETSQALQEYLAEGADPTRAKLIAPVVGTINGMLESLTDTPLLKRLTSPDRILPGGFVDGVKFTLSQFLKGGAEETGQELTTLGGQAASTGRTPQDILPRLATAAVAGSIAEAGMGGGVAALGSAQRKIGDIAYDIQESERMAELARLDANEIAMLPEVAQQFRSATSGEKRNLFQPPVLEQDFSSPTASPVGVTPPSSPVDPVVTAPRERDPAVIAENEDAIARITALNKRWAQLASLIIAGRQLAAERTTPEASEQRRAQREAEAKRAQGRANVEAGLVVPETFIPRQVAPQPVAEAAPEPQPVAPLQQGHQQLLEALTEVYVSSQQGGRVTPDSLIDEAAKSADLAIRLASRKIAELESNGETERTAPFYAALEAARWAKQESADRATRRSTPTNPQVLQGAAEEAVRFAGPSGWEAVDPNPAVELLPVGVISSDVLLGGLEQHKNPVLSRMAKTLRSRGVVPNVVILDDNDTSMPEDRAAEFDPETNTVRIRRAASRSTHIQLHEFSHAGLINALRGDLTFRRQMIGLMEEASLQLGEGRYGLRRMKPDGSIRSDFERVMEFTAEAMSNPTFQEELRRLKRDKLSLWQKFVQLVRRLFGRGQVSENFLDKVLSAIEPRIGPATPGTEAPLAAPRVYKSMEDVQAALDVPGLTPEQQDFIRQEAGSQAGLIPLHIAHGIRRLAFPVPGETPHEAKVRKRTHGIVDWIVKRAAVATPVDLRSVPKTTQAQRDQAGVYAGSTLQADWDIRQAAENNDRYATRDQKNMTAFVAKYLPIANTSDLKGQYLKGAMTQAVDDMDEYLVAQRATTSNLTTQEQATIKKASDTLAGLRRTIRGNPEELSNAIEILAKLVPEAVVQTAPDNWTIVNYALRNNLFTQSSNPIPQDVIYFLTTPLSATRQAPLLAYRGLIPTLKKLQTINRNTGVLEQDIRAFENFWHQVNNTPNRVPVSFRQFLSKYNQLRDQYKEAVDTVATIHKSIATWDSRVRARNNAKTIYENLINDPQYQEQVAEALKLIEAYDTVRSGYSARIPKEEEKFRGKFQRYEIGDNVYEVTWSLGPGMEKENIDTIGAMVRDLEGQLNRPDLDERDRASYTRLIEHINQFMQLGGTTPQYSRLQPGFFDIVNFLRFRLKFASALMTNSQVMRNLPGRIRDDLILAIGAADAADKGLRKVALHKEYGTVEIAKAVTRALESHPGMSPQAWEWTIAEPTIAANQSSVGLNARVGQELQFGGVITAEDMRALKLMHKFSAELHKIVEGPGAVSASVKSHPLLIEDKRAGVVRKAIAGGPLITSRRFNRGDARDSRFADNWYVRWSTAMKETSTDPVARMAKVLSTDLLGDEDFYRNVALSYVVEKNPEFAFKSEYAPIYRQLALDYLSNKKPYPATFDELVSDIMDLRMAQRNISPSATRANERSIFLKKFIEELSGVFTAYSTAIAARIEEHKDEFMLNDVTDAMQRDTIMSIQDVASSFSKERGAMVAPSTFYRYSLASNASQGGMMKSAMLPFINRHMQVMAAASSELNKEYKRLESEVERGIITDKGIREKVKSGELYATLSELRLMQNSIDNALQIEKDTVTSSAAAAARDPGLLESFFNVDRTLLLSQGTSLTGNLMSALGLGQAIPAAVMQRNALAVQKAFLAAPRSAMLLLAKVFGETPQGKWLAANRATLFPVLKQAANLIYKVAQAKTMAIEDNILPERRKIGQLVEDSVELGNISGQSPVRPVGQHRNTPARRISEWFGGGKKRALIGTALMNLSAIADNIGNQLNLVAAEEDIADWARLFYRAMKIKADLNVPGWNDFSNPDNWLKPEELKMSPESMAILRQILVPAGGVEQVAYNYFRAVEAAPADQRGNVPLMPRDALADVRRTIIGFSNYAMMSNRPSIVRGETVIGNLIRTFFTFPGWFSGFLGVIQLMMSKLSRRPGWQKFGLGIVATAFVLMLLTMLGFPVLQSKALVYQLTQGRPAPWVTGQTFLEDPSWTTATKLAGASIAMAVPYIGEMMAEVVGSPTFRSNPTDLTSLSRTAGMLSSLLQAAKYGVNTGDGLGVVQQLLRAMVPIGSPAWNRLGFIEERNIVPDATRVARVAAGPLEVADMGGRGSGSGTPSRFSSLIRRAVAASGSGDTSRAQEFLRLAAGLKREEGVANPMGAVRAALASQDPERKAFGRRLTEEERAGLSGRMVKGQLAAYNKGRNAVLRLVGLNRSPTKKRASRSFVRKPSVRIRKPRPLGYVGGTAQRASLRTF